MKTSEKQPEKLHEFYIGERTTLTIENVLIPTLMTVEDYAKFTREQFEKDKPSTTYFMPEEITDNNNRKLKLVCHAIENDKSVFYYKFECGY